ncbi:MULTISPECIES: hypothetical protein [Burkholderia]|uniref:Uncharacterized protein n=2 Tax=Burkholderia cepacia complex TaxID=87882 RepID=A0AAP1V512_9BURK|nr:MULTISPECIES: hypothetical protein [Burkholderia]MBK1902003.1 hypothetical protein [Burkholderia contaminans]MBK1910286.1 hypothetical protein [Burkholderia contaminans]MBK1923745.1 hypothetical protein [Burkholderia contaminans]MBK1931957.1 hypothetical protein [Burkholderia contaminans]MBK1939206.1 hypothetical protein [Burkholderia contaminans]
MKRIHEVCIRWHQTDGEQGSFTESVEVLSQDEAVRLIARKMATMASGCGASATEEEIREFVDEAEERVEYVVELSARASRDLQAVLGDELAGQQLDPTALIELIKEHRERVTKPVAKRAAV